MVIVRTKISYLIILLLGQSAFAQLPLISVLDKSEPAAAIKTESPVDLTLKRKQINEELRVALRTLDAAKQASKENTNPPEKLQRDVDLLKQLDAILAQHKTAQDQEKSLQDKLADLKGQLEAIRLGGPTEDKPYSFLLLDQLQDEFTAKQARKDIRQVEVSDAQEALLRAKEDLDAKQKALRLLKTEVEAAKDESEKSEKAANVTLTEAEEQIAEETVELKKQELTNEKLSAQIQGLEVELLAEKINWISKDVIFSPEDLQDQLVFLDKLEADLKSKVSTTDSNLTLAEQDLAQDKRELESQESPPLMLIEQVEARKLTRQRLLHSQQILNARLERVARDREIWNKRYKVLTAKADPEELITWVNEANAYIAQAERKKRTEQSRIEDLRRELSNVESESQDADEKLGEAKRWVESQREEIAKTIRIHENSIDSIEDSISLQRKLVDEIEGDVKQWTFKEWVAGVWHYVSKIWNTELYSIDDNPLTVGKLVYGILLIVAGLLIASRISRILGRRLPRTVGINESGAAAIQSLSFYLMVILFTLMALRVVNVPLTLFAFLGGAVAIGVGFGSQNILNNFISGLILLAERPIRVGDLIQLDMLHGTVEHVGTRSTRIRTANNMEIIVPNSSFLENNVLNHTLGDNIVRTCVSVGIAYGSPTREAAKLLKRAAQEHGLVLSNPEPFVWFVEFGDNSLVFELHFWVEVRNLSERKRVESDMRFRIDHLFRDAGIVIAYPQRDIHLDVKQPLDIRLHENIPIEVIEDGSQQAA